MKPQKIIFVVGPTAVGKTEVAFLLARKIKGEIISLDAMQVYKEISVLSNKPSGIIRKKIPHHLVDVVSIRQNFDAAVFRKKALAAVKRIIAKRKIPVIAGGSGFYMTVLLDGIFKGVGASERIRKRLEREEIKNGCGFLHQKLERIDPQAALKIHPHDTKRIIRALEVFALTRKPISELQKKREGLWGKFDIRIFALNRDRGELYKMIDDRVDAMFKEGAVGEVEDLIKRKWSKTAEAIIGVKEIKSFLNGQHDCARARDLIKRNTRRYAKRQLTWFRRDKRLCWITIGGNDKPSLIVSKIINSVRNVVSNGAKEI
ncbi:MAG TPA: tRNA (adenosine(37)-N6)-dimethylallyltransferase MiaA [Candidatus Omnitrophota bacterium]|nr:tRNA (adenosine(37)-N6)-dimethylallyltransferase MiaA [Candidatus Omnitrophota bacterium]HPD84182.1 tRNA (adenosine(37)-N6)-dimethylallyltransferase MiaA [Candidatus Omnitrophota bacterium]HRZ03038.1 tRNA (adenosine(37)-N6)-dimethylallyltransferase MiaA [Candidatus Omnitrophota bacterium]